MRWLAILLVLLGASVALAQGTYILDDDGNPVPEPSPEPWSQWMADNDRVILDDTLHCTIRVTTKFLGFSKPRPSPLPNAFYVTRTIGGPLNGTVKYSATLVAAKLSHIQAVADSKAEISPP